MRYTILVSYTNILWHAYLVSCPDIFPHAQKEEIDLGTRLMSIMHSWCSETTHETQSSMAFLTLVGDNQWVNTVEPHPAETYEKWPFTILWTLHLVLIVLTFLNIVWQQRGPKMRPRCFQHPEHTLPCLPEVYQKPLKYRHFPITKKTAVIPTVSTLDGFHCSWKFRQCNS